MITISMLMSATFVLFTQQISITLPFISKKKKKCVLTVYECTVRPLSRGF